MKNYVLQTLPLNESHTGENVAKVLDDAISTWHLGEKPPLVTDNAANMIRAGQIAGCEPHIGCYAHTINIAAKKGLKLSRLSQLRARIRNIVSFFHRSSGAAALLKNKAKVLALPDHKLINEVETRWNSTHDMIERFTEMQCGVFAVFHSKELSSTKDKSASSLSDEDIALAEECVNNLQSLKAITTLLCTESTPTVSMIMPLQHQLKTMMVDKPDDSQVIKEMKRIINSDLETRYIRHRDTLLVYTAIDPRFKSLAFLTENDRSQVYDNLATCVLKLMENAPAQVKTEPNEPPEENPPLPLLDPNQDQPAKRVKKEKEESTKSTLSSLLGDVFVTKVELARPAIQRVQDELKLYLQLPSTLQDNPLIWWRENSSRLPYFAGYARSVLCIPATSVPSERVFSTAGDIVTAERSSLAPESVNMLIFLKKNL